MFCIAVNHIEKKMLIYRRHYKILPLRKENTFYIKRKKKLNSKIDKRTINIEKQIK